ncbi:MAG: SusC/RagA family TonB-linked outer membrane protein [Calditrichaeota bacterium]|nr:MAG: SusC/RagA family TonB-linked outer membrane protein [Calditrichota bacterium]
MKPKFVMFLAWILILLPLEVMAQGSATIRGRVFDETGNPLAGANVFIKGTTHGSATDVDGVYRFTIPAQEVKGQQVELTVNFIGYRSQTVKITITPGTITKNFTLVGDVLELESIVVTGMGGSQIKEKLGVDIARVKPDAIVQSNEPNVVEALAGKAPGIQVTQTSGDPGTNSYIRIRGAASIDRPTQPLFVVDGVPISNRTDYTIGFNGGTETSNRAADINTEDIASIEILKGAAAAAIYGSRASNGVVLITTKSGRPGRTKISYKFSVGATQLSNTYPVQRWFGQGTKGKYVKDYSRSWGRPLNVPDAPWFDPNQPVDTVYDHLDEISSTGWSNENNITISGGRENTTFFLSFGRLYQGGHWKADLSPSQKALGMLDLIKGKPTPARYERWTGRVKATQVISSKLKLTGNLAFANTDANYIQRGDNAIGLMLETLRTPPEFNNWPYIDPNTGFHRSYRYSEAEVLKKSRKFDNPFFTLYENKNPREVGRVYGYIRADYDLFDWFKVNYTLGSDYSSDAAMYLNPPSGSREGGRGHLRKSNFTYQETDGNLVATIQGDKFLKKFKNVNATLMFGHNINIRKYHRLQTTGIDMGVPGFNQLDNTVSTNLSTDEYEFLIHTESFFGQLTLDLFNQLYLTGALRNDGSSTFGKSKRRHWYPKFSSAWEFTKFKKVPYLNFGKLRFAYGEAGVQPGVYTTITGYSSGNKGFGIFTSTQLNTTYRGKSGYFSSSNLGNDEVKPERTKEYEYGVNLGFFNSRVGLDVTRYRDRSTDVLFDLNMVPSTGAFSQTRNAATIENKGWEVTLNLLPIRKRNLSWNLDLTYTRNKNMVLDMSGAKWVQVGRWAYAGPGHELGEMRLLTWIRFGRKDLNNGHGEKVDIDGDGMINVPDSPNYDPNKPIEYIDEYYAGQWKPGDVYIPADGYPRMSEHPMWSGLSSNPKWMGSIRSEVTLFNKITITAFLDAVQGHYIMNHAAGALYSYGTHAGTADRGQVKSIPLKGKFGSGPFGRKDVKGIGPGAENGVPKPVELTESWYRSAGAGFQGDGFQFTEDASYVKLREISISYRWRSMFLRRFGLSEVMFRLSGRNLKTWTDYTGFDPETNRRQATSERDSDYFNQPQTKSYVLSVYVNY